MYGWSGMGDASPSGVTADPLSPLWYQQIADLAKIPGITIKSDPVPIESFFGSIPWWGWIAGAGVGYWALKGRR